ncbi:MAG TPA: TetR/AcrR family transcriptional regulator [Nocardioidaceae bacterium]|nr:TetR/AcrR family transcriptional regulator [Nocardioidaceae bacterium]
MESERDTFARIQSSALSLIATQGFAATGIRQIADGAGISVASLYHYMGTKEDLLERMMRDSMQSLLSSAQDAVEAASNPPAQLARLVDVHVRKHARDNMLSLVADTELRSLSPDRRREIVKLRDAYESVWASVISAGASSGVFKVPDVKLAIFAILGMCTGVVYWYSPDGRLSLDDISAAYVSMALSLLSRKGPTGRRKA